MLCLVLQSDDENEEDENGDDSDGESRTAKRRRLDEEQLLKRREKRLWEENRNKLLFEYSQFTYYARAVCDDAVMIVNFNEFLLFRAPFVSLN